MRASLAAMTETKKIDPTKTDTAPPAATPPVSKPSLIGLEQEGIHENPPPPPKAPEWGSDESGWGTDETRKG